MKRRSLAAWSSATAGAAIVVVACTGPVSSDGVGETLGVQRSADTEPPGLGIYRCAHDVFDCDRSDPAVCRASTRRTSAEDCAPFYAAPKETRGDCTTFEMPTVKTCDFVTRKAYCTTDLGDPLTDDRTEAEREEVSCRRDERDRCVYDWRSCPSAVPPECAPVITTMPCGDDGSAVPCEERKRTIWPKCKLVPEERICAVAERHESACYWKLF